MQTAGARALREDNHEDMSREAVLLQWERKIEAEERRPSRSERADDDSGEGGTVAELRPTEDATHEARAASSAARPSCSRSSRSPSAARSPSPATRHPPAGARTRS